MVANMDKTYRHNTYRHKGKRRQLGESNVHAQNKIAAKINIFEKLK